MEAFVLAGGIAPKWFLIDSIVGRTLYATGYQILFQRVVCIVDSSNNQIEIAIPNSNASAAALALSELCFAFSLYNAGKGHLSQCPRSVWAKVKNSGR